MIPLSLPHLNGNEWRYVKECLETGWISSAGNFVHLFEKSVAKEAETSFGAACVNGTAGLHLALICSGVKSGDHIIVPNLTFVATLNAVRHVGADPIMVDIDQGDWQMDLDLLENFLHKQTEIKEGLNGKECFFTMTNRRIRAIIPVHVLGNMGDMDRLMSLAKDFYLDIIEDSAEALGSTYNGKKAGSFGKFGVFSFNGNKIISTGGGGVVVCQNETLDQQVKHLSSQAKVSSDTYDHDQIGYNYRLVNILAAVGLAQMEQFPQHLAKKKEIDRFYRKELEGVGDLVFQTIRPETDPNCWLFTFRTSHSAGLLKFLTDREIQCRPFWKPMNQLPMFKNFHYETKSNVSDQVFNQGISIPSSVGLTLEEMEFVAKSIKSYFNSNGFEKKIQSLSISEKL